MTGWSAGWNVSTSFFDVDNIEPGLEIRFTGARNP
jgi:hypothetical protein